MKFNKRLFRKMVFLFSAISLVMLAMRLVTYFTELEPSTGLFRGSGAFCIAYNAAGFLAFFLFLAFSLSKKGSDVSAPKRKSEAGAELLLHRQEIFDEEEIYPQYFHQGFTRKTVVWTGTLSAFSCFLPGFGFLSYALSFYFSTDVSADIYTLLGSVLSVLSGAYFIFTAIRNSPELDRKQAFFALIPALWCTVRLVSEYRDLVRFVNKSLYVGQFLFLISALFFFLYQAQLLLGENSMTRPNSYAFTALSTVFFGISARLPHLIAGALDRVRLDLVDASALLIDLAITLYVAVKISVIIKRSRNS